MLEWNSLGELHLQTDGLGNVISLNLLRSRDFLESDQDENMRLTTKVKVSQPAVAVG